MGVLVVFAFSVRSALLCGGRLVGRWWWWWWCRSEVDRCCVFFWVMIRECAGKPRGRNARSNCPPPHRWCDRVKAPPPPVVVLAESTVCGDLWRGICCLCVLSHRSLVRPYYSMFYVEITTSYAFIVSCNRAAASSSLYDARMMILVAPLRVASVIIWTYLSFAGEWIRR